MPVQAFIFDLDGTILDTESLVTDVARQVVQRRQKSLSKEVIKAASGKRPLEAWADVVQLLEIVESPQTLLDESEPLLTEQWADARMLPGAMRLLQHLKSHGITIAVATSTPRATFNKKMAKKPELAALLAHVVCGDEVTNGKPSPDLFTAAVARLGVHPAHCVAVEDAVNGVMSATAAGLRVVAVPSSWPDVSDYAEADPAASSGVVQLLPSLMAFDPTSLGLPPFNDTVNSVIPMDTPIKIRGTVVKGFGRGSKELGIPTANVDGEALHASLCEAVTGVYAGWVSIGDSDQVYKTALSIGWNPHFGNTHKTCEPWILHDFDQPFYDTEIRLLVVGYVRPECKFTSLQALIDRILLDGEVSKVALEDPRLKGFCGDSFLKPGAAAAS